MNSSKIIIPYSKVLGNLVQDIYESGHVEEETEKREQDKEWADQQHENYLNNQADKGFV